MNCCQYKCNCNKVNGSCNIIKQDVLNKIYKPLAMPIHIKTNSKTPFSTPNDPSDNQKHLPNTPISRPPTIWIRNSDLPFKKRKDYNF